MRDLVSERMIGADAGEGEHLERERELAVSLRQRLPVVAVIEADAGDLDAVLREMCVPWLAAVVSS